MGGEAAMLCHAMHFWQCARSSHPRRRNPIKDKTVSSFHRSDGLAQSWAGQTSVDCSGLHTQKIGQLVKYHTKHSKGLGFKMKIIQFGIKIELEH